MKTQFTVEYYITATGYSPVIEWIDSLDRATKSKVLRRIQNLEMGHFGDFKSVGGVMELRFHAIGPGYRLYFTQIAQTLVLLLCGGTKKTQQADIQKAQELKEDYERR